MFTDLIQGLHNFDSIGRTGVRYSLSMFPNRPAASILYDSKAVMPDTILSLGLTMKQVWEI